MENNKLRELSKAFFENNEKPTEYELYKFLVDNEWKIYADYQKQTFVSEINYFLTRNDYDADKVPNDIIESMLERVEDHLNSTDEFEHIFEYVIDDYKEDLEEYKIIEVEDDDRSEMPHDYTNHFDSGEENK